jgi:hypothetical protein
MSEVTRILEAAQKGDPTAADQLLPLVYDELRRLAAAKMSQEAPGQTLNPPHSCMKPGCDWSATRIRDGTVARTSSAQRRKRCGAS